MRAVGVGPAVRGWRDRRECVWEMLVVWRESCEAGRLLVAKLLQCERDVGRWRRDGSGRYRRDVSGWRRRDVSSRRRWRRDVSGRRRWRRDVSGRRLVGGHSVGRRKHTFEHVARGRCQTYVTLQRR